MKYKVLNIPFEAYEHTVEELLNDPKVTIIREQKVTKKMGKEEFVYFLITIRVNDSDYIGWYK